MDYFDDDDFDGDAPYSYEPAAVRSAPRRMRATKKTPRKGGTCHRCSNSCIYTYLGDDGKKRHGGGATTVNGKGVYCHDCAKAIGRWCSERSTYVKTKHAHSTSN